MNSLHERIQKNVISKQPIKTKPTTVQYFKKENETLNVEHNIGLQPGIEMECEIFV